MTEHLEPYRRMVRSMRFVPALGRQYESHQSQMPSPPPLNFSSSVPSTVPPVREAAPDPSEHIAALVREAVSKPTVLPVTYAIAENIGDRISRMTTPKKKQSPEIIAFKIPQPDPNWKPATTVSDWQKSEDLSHQAFSAPVEVEETANVEVSPVEAEIPAPVGVEETPKVEVSPVEAETPDALGVEENAIALSPVEAETSDAVGVEETPKVEVSPVEAETPAADPVSDQSTEETTAADAVVEEMPETPSDEPEATQQPTLLDKAASAIEAVLSVFQKPETDQNEPDATVESSPTKVEAEIPASVSPASEEPTQEATAADAVVQEMPETPSNEPEATQQPTLLDKAASAIEAVTSIFQNPAADQNESAVAPSPAADQKAAESEMSQITCPKCGATEVRKNGHYKEKQRYVCKECGKQFMPSDSVEPQQPQASSVKSDQPSSGISQAKKGKKQAKGFGRPKS
ncbi:IS1/IS1595 family N-terminal zinc-binding domain-containing protein [Trichocoleus sp. FACHB-69]|uniref:IS1/IS1595 family N-terminal zinc-binding domain-containing protein n=1 Tax=Cyanophyceae TaxID=3028117 RepID=UPI0016891307|nr:hypothetical protein [Trichocoleus sp. FACHB-69]